MSIFLASVAAAMFAVCTTAQADTESDLRAKIDALQKQLDDVKAQLNQITNQVQQTQTQVQQTQQAQKEQEKKNDFFLQRKEGSGLTFLVPGGGEVSLYGNLDLTFRPTCPTWVSAVRIRSRTRASTLSGS